MVLLVTARWDSSECNPVNHKHPPLPTQNPSLALISSSDGGRTFDSNLTILEGAKCGSTCNPHATWARDSKKIVVVFRGAQNIMSVISTNDPLGHTNWTHPVRLTPFVGSNWAGKSLPGPGAALTVKLPVASDKSERLIFCAHAGAYHMDVVFFSDDGGATFNVSSSTPYNAEHNAMKGMDECALGDEWPHKEAPKKGRANEPSSKSHLPKRGLVEFNRVLGENR